MKDDAKKGTNNKNVIDMINLMLYYTHTLYYIIYSDRTNSTNYLFISQVESIRTMEYSNDLHIHRVRRLKAIERRARRHYDDRH